MRNVKFITQQAPPGQLVIARDRSFAKRNMFRYGVSTSRTRGQSRRHYGRAITRALAVVRA